MGGRSERPRNGNGEQKMSLQRSANNDTFARRARANLFAAHREGINCAGVRYMHIISRDYLRVSIGALLALWFSAQPVWAQQSKNFVFARVPAGFGGGLGAGGFGSGFNPYGSPVRSMTAQIRAYNRLMNAYNSANGSGNGNSYAQNPFFTQMQIQNSVAYVRAYYEKKAIYESERAKRYVEPLDHEKLRNSKTWGWLKDHPEMTVKSIVEGQAQNFLLHRLAGTMLAMQFSADDKGPEADMLKKLELAPAMLHQLRLRQDLPNAEGLVFRADEGTALSNEWWPYSLRGDEFASLRAAFDKARRAAADEAQQGAVSNRTLDELMKALADIGAEFHKRADKSVRLKSPQNFQHFLTAQRFLQGLGGEIARMQATGDGTALDGSLKFKADNLIDLLAYMSRHGLEFAPAKPGDEEAYQAVFRMMRDVYVTIADNDESIKPKKDRQKEKDDDKNATLIQ